MYCTYGQSIYWEAFSRAYTLRTLRYFGDWSQKNERFFVYFGDTFILVFYMYIGV